MENFCICWELKCGVCLFTKPKVLPCQHIFCLDCLHKAIQKKKTWLCPVCRQKADLQSGGVVGLPDNPYIADLSEKLKNQGHDHDEHYNISIDLKRDAKVRRAKVQARLTEGRSIQKRYWSYIQGLRQEEITLHKQKQQIEKDIDQAYNKNKLKVTQSEQETIDNERKELLMGVEQNHKANSKMIQEGKEKMLSNVSELSAACDQAEQELECHWGDVKILALGTTLTVVTEYSGREPQFPSILHVVFKPALSPLMKLGNLRITVHNFPAAPASTSGAARGTGHQQRVTFGGEGQELGQFDDPSGIAVSDEGVIFVADSGNQRIQVFTLQGTFVRQFPTVLPGGQKMKPEDMALDRNGNLWVVDSGNAVQYNKYGTVLKHVELAVSRYFRGVAVDTRSNNILVTQRQGSNPSNPRGEVQVFRPDGTLNVETAGKEGMNFPQYITVDGEGKILVTDEDSHYVYVFHEDGQFLFQFGGEGSGVGQLSDPRGICTDRAGNIIVADHGNGRVEMFDKTGVFIKHIATNMAGPQAVAMGTHGQLVVADSVENEVTLFQNP